MLALLTGYVAVGSDAAEAQTLKVARGGVPKGTPQRGMPYKAWSRTPTGVSTFVEGVMIRSRSKVIALNLLR